MHPVIRAKFFKALQLPVQRQEELAELVRVATYNKHEVIRPPGNIFNRLGYIAEGAIRTYYVNDKGEETSYLLQVNGDFFGDYESYITGRPSDLVVEALLKTEVVFFEKSSIDALTDKDVFWMGFARQVSDLAFLDAKQRLNGLLFYSPEERYLNLLNKSPEVLQKIPQKYISTYLGITPQSLSRIRKRLINLSERLLPVCCPNFTGTNN